jgi:hypothetical protein
MPNIDNLIFLAFLKPLVSVHIFSLSFPFDYSFLFREKPKTSWLTECQELLNTCQRMIMCYKVYTMFGIFSLSVKERIIGICIITHKWKKITLGWSWFFSVQNWIFSLYCGLTGNGEEKSKISCVEYDGFWYNFSSINRHRHCVWRNIQIDMIEMVILNHIDQDVSLTLISPIRIV